LIEQIMIFLLGALSVGLLALLLVPAISRRASRLARRRLEMLLPLSMDEVVAERDLLRAEFAAERRRLEQRMEAQAATQAEELAELGRRATEIVSLKDQLGKLRGEHSTLNAAHAAAARDLAEAQGERSALLTEIHDATGLHEAIRARFEELTRAHHELADVAEGRRTSIVAMETKIAGLDARIEGLERDLDAQTRRAKNGEDRATGLGEERDMLLRELRSIEQLMASTQERFEKERARADELQERLDEQRAEVDDALLAQREAQKIVESAERARDAAQEMAREASRRLDVQLEETRRVESAAADQIEALRAEIAALKGALIAARDARATNGRGSQETTELRDAIAEIGAKVARMAQQERVNE
jgi:chromosome segregation ATPase